VRRGPRAYRETRSSAPASEQVLDAPPADPDQLEAAAAALAERRPAGEAVRIPRRRDQVALGALTRASDVELRTAKLDRVLEHNAGDLTAVLEAGVPLARATSCSLAGQMIANRPVPRG